MAMRISTLVTILVLVFIAFVDYSLISPFIPPQAIKLGMSYTLISLIFSSYFIWGAIFSIVTGKIASTLGRKNCIVIGATAQAVAIVWTAFLYNMTDYWLYTIYLFIIRFLQGAGDGLVTVGVYSLLSIYYNDDQYQSKLALVNMIVGIGIAFGPIIGEYAVDFFNMNYEYPLLIIGGVHLLIVLYAMVSFDNDLKMKVQERKYSRELVPPTYCDILSHEVATLNYVSCLLAIGCISIPLPLLSSVMLSPPYSTTNNMVGIFLCLLNLTEVLGSLYISYFANNMVKSKSILYGQFGMFLGLFILGQPWILWTKSEPSLIPMGVGLSLVGLGMVFSFIVIVPANKEYFESIKNLKEEEKRMWGDGVAGLFGMFYEMGGFVVPFLGGVLMDMLGFELMCLVCSAVPFIFTLWYFMRVVNRPTASMSGVQVEMIGK